jgi:hypothetical protein
MAGRTPHGLSPPSLLQLQSDVCLEAMGVEWDEVTAEAVANDILYLRVPVFDFDRIDQVRTLPPSVRQRKVRSLHSVGLVTWVTYARWGFYWSTQPKWEGAVHFLKALLTILLPPTRQTSPTG